MVESIIFRNAKGMELSTLPLLSDGNIISIEIIIDKKELTGDLGIDLVLTTHNTDSNEYIYHSSTELPLVRREGSELYFKLDYAMTESGSYNYAFRMFPKHEDMAHRMDFSYVKWI